MKTVRSVSIDVEIIRESIPILKKLDTNMSNFVQKKLKKLILEENKNGIN
ncbi:hypothetical protein K8R47_02785 [archaeon]|nr:hypothetical protein [archaeon]